MKKTILTGLATIAVATISTNAATILIDGSTGSNIRNGGFTGPNQTQFSAGVTDWTSVLDSGDDKIENGGTGTQAILQIPGGIIANQTTYAVQLGDVFTFGLDNNRASRELTYGIGFSDGAGGFTTFGSNSSAVDEISRNTYTVMAGDALIGENIALVIERTGAGNYARFDDAFLEVQSIPEPSSIALLGLGGLALIIRRRK